MARSPCYEALQRSFSMASLDEAGSIRDFIKNDLKEPEDKSRRICFTSIGQFSFFLQPFTNCVSDYREFLAERLIDKEMLKELENSKELNWCPSLRLFVPIPTMGDGNCLFHAASLSLMGVHDRYLTVRKAIHRELSEDCQGYYRVRWQTEHEISFHRQGIQCNDAELDREWNKVIQLVSEEEFPNGPDGLQYGGTEEIHIFALANVIRRPVIIICDEILRGWYGESLSTVPFGGVYLPLNWDPIDCEKTPLVLGYSNSHFTALVPISDGNLDIVGRSDTVVNPYAFHGVPLVKYNGTSLKVHFLKGIAERQNQDGLLRQYLNCSRIPRHSGTTDEILVARFTIKQVHPSVSKMVTHFYSFLLTEFQRQRQEYELLQASHYTASKPDKLVQCTTPGCGNLAQLSTGQKCGKCNAKLLRDAQLLHEGNPPFNPQFPYQKAQTASPSISQPMDTTPAPAIVSQTPQPQEPQGIDPTVGHAKVRCPTPNCKYYVYTQADKYCQRCKESEMANSKSIPCEMPGCQFSGTRENNNLCSRCFIEFRQGLSVAAPSAPPANQCCNPECPNPGCPELVGRCPPCYMQSFRDFINPVTRKLHEASTCELKGCQNPQSPEFGAFCAPCYEKLRRRSFPDITQYAMPQEIQPCQYQSTVTAGAHAKTPLRVNIPAKPMTVLGTASPVSAAPMCSTPNCQNLRGPPHMGTLCSDCYKTRGMPNSNVQLFNLNNTTPITIASGNGLPPVIECNMKDCKLPAAANPFNLCIDHFTSIRSSQQMPLPSEPQFEPLAECQAGNCAFYAGPETNYLCSRHFAKQTRYEEPFHAYPPLDQSPEVKRCAIDGCYNPAREDLNGLCLKCYENSVNLEIQQQNQPFADHREEKPGHGNAEGIQNKQTRSRTPSPRVLIPCKTSGCPNLVDSADQKIELCMRCSHGNNDVIRRGNKPSDTGYRPNLLLQRPPGAQGADAAGLNRVDNQAYRQNEVVQRAAEVNRQPVYPPRNQNEPVQRSADNQLRDALPGVAFPGQPFSAPQQMDVGIIQPSNNPLCANSPQCNNPGDPHSYNFCVSCFQQVEQSRDLSRDFNNMALQK